ncbi:MAG: type II secretion system secretin GspD [Deltaproteobacteria bacterium]|nr:type II secretion system secretin GspD [Deltaproteobacteria bacterium]
MLKVRRRKLTGPIRPSIRKGVRAVAAVLLMSLVHWGQPVRPVMAAPVDEDTIDFNFSGEVELKALIKNFAKLTNRNFLLPENFKDSKVTVISPRKLTLDEGWRVFETILSQAGYTIVPGKSINRIVTKKDSISLPIPTYRTDRLTPGSTSESFVTRLFPLQHTNVEEMKNIIRPFVTKDGDLVSYAPTNLLIITETSNNINHVLRLLEELDTPSTEEVVEIIRVKNAGADELAGQLTQIFSGTGKSAGKAPAGGGAAGQTAPSAISTTDYKIIPDMRTNSLIVVASKKVIGEIKKLLARLDVPATEETASGALSIFVHKLKHADASELAGTLTGLITGNYSGTGSSLSRSAASAAAMPATTGTRGGSTRTRGGGSSLARNSQQAAQQQLSQLQRGAAGTQPGAMPGTPGAAGQNPLQFEDQIRIVADVPTNSLLITSTRRDYETIRKVIDRLDVARPQVYVEAAIFEVNATDSSIFGIGWAGGGDGPRDGTIFLQQSTAVPSGVGIINATTGGGAGTGSNPLTALSGPGLTAAAIGKLIDIKGPAPSDGSEAPTLFTIPQYSAILNAAKSDREVNVLSTPSVLTSDNEQAQIVVATNVPIPTGQTIGVGGTTTQTINREDVGITLRITPQINDASSLRLNIYVEVSNVSQGSFGVDTANLGIVTAVRSAESVVVVRDRQPVIIGGLMQTNDNVNETKMPILGDIPILGFLFRSRATVVDKTNLLIVITPRVVRDQLDTSRIIAFEADRRKQFIDNELLDTWLMDKSNEAKREAFAIPPQDYQLPDQLQPGEVLITPEGAFGSEEYNRRMPPKGEVDELVPGGRKPGESDVMGVPFDSLRRTQPETGADNLALPPAPPQEAPPPPPAEAAPTAPAPPPAE